MTTIKTWQLAIIVLGVVLAVAGGISGALHHPSAAAPAATTAPEPLPDAGYDDEATQTAAAWLTDDQACSKVENTGWFAAHDTSALECIGSGSEWHGRHRTFVVRTLWSGKWRAAIHTTGDGQLVFDDSIYG
jgi:hypothetical protein